MTAADLTPDPGTTAPDPAQNDERHRAYRQRLQDALVELVAERGYPDTKIKDVCAHAHVAPRDLYEQYPGKQELLLSTCDAIVDDACASVRSWRRSNPLVEPDFEAAVASVLTPLARAMAARPAHASLVLIDVYSAGSVGPPYRHGMVMRLNDLLQDALRDVPGPTALSEASVLIVAAGTLQAFQRRVRAGRPRTLPTVARDLAGWAARYATAAPLPLPTPTVGTPRRSDDRVAPLPRNTQRLPRQFVVPHQRDRILRAVAELAAQDGYSGVAIPAIAAEAQVSLRTFYQHFESKHEAFNAVYDHAFERLFTLTWGAATRQSSWPDAVREGVRAWVAYVADEPTMARFGFSDVLTAGREAVERVDDAYFAFSDLFGRGRPGDAEVSDIAAYAIAGGIGGLVAHWISDGRATEIQQLAPHLIYAILAPATGDAAALHSSGLAPVPTVIAPPAPANDGQRVAVAYAALVATEGFETATLAAAAEIAGVDPVAVREFFDDEADCALQTLDAWTDRTFTAMAAAFASAPRDGALAAHRSLGAMLAQMASEPAMLHLAVEAVEHLGPRAVARRARYASVFYDAIAPAVNPNDPIPTNPRQMSEMVADGVFGVLRRHVHEGRIAELPSALPEISYLCIAPFFGPERAVVVAQLPLAPALTPLPR